MSDRTAVLLVLSIIIGVPLLTLALLARAIWHLVRMQRLRLSETEPRCGRCGYIIAPPSSGRCPECGSVLREVGVVAPASYRRAYPMGRLFLIGAALFAIAMGIGRLAAPLFPWSWSYSSWAKIAFPPPHQPPDAPATTEFCFAAVGHGRWIWNRPRFVTLIWTDRPGNYDTGWWLRSDRSDPGVGGISHGSAFGNDREPALVQLNEEGFARYLERIGYPIEGPDVTALSRQLNAQMKELWLGRLPAPPDKPQRYAARGTQYFRDGNGWQVAVGLWLVTWCWFGVKLYHWHRRRREQARLAGEELLEG